MNGDQANNINQSIDTSSDDENEEQHKISLQARRRRYYEERKRKMMKTKAPTNFDFNEEFEKSEGNFKQDTENRFLNVRVTSKISNTPSQVSENPEDNTVLRCELEIPDFLNFGELIPKAVDVFNSQLQEAKSDISINKDNASKCGFRYAKKDGRPDMNLPAFDSRQKVSECGVTNLCLMLEDNAIIYAQRNMIKMDSSTMAETQNSVIESSNLRKTETKNKNSNKSKEIDENNKDRMSKTNSSCK